MAAESELTILKNAEVIADAVWDRVGEWDAFAKDTLGRQLVRAADSIGANIAESCGRFHFGDKIQFLYYSRGSLYETKYWINRAFRRELIAKREGEATIAALSGLAHGLNTFIKGLKDVRTEYPTRNTAVREASVEYGAPQPPEEFIDEDMWRWFTALEDNRPPRGWTPPNH